MNFNNYIFYDMETTSANPQRTQPTQLAAVAIDGRNLEVLDVFSSYINILNEEESEKYGLDYMQAGAMEVTGITPEFLSDKPGLKTVWGNFTEFVNKYNPKGNKWTRPIRCGYNIIKFDDPIMFRICKGHNNNSIDLKELAEEYIDDDYRDKFLKEYKAKFCQEPWGFGPWNKDRDEQDLFHPRDVIDVMPLYFLWTENLKEVNSIAMDAVRKWWGMSLEGAHNATIDVLQGSYMLVKFLKYMRSQSKRMKFKDCFVNLNDEITSLAKKYKDV